MTFAPDRHQTGDPYWDDVQYLCDEWRQACGDEECRCALVRSAYDAGRASVRRQMKDPGLTLHVAVALKAERWMFDPPGLSSFRLAQVSMQAASSVLEDSDFKRRP